MWCLFFFGFREGFEPTSMQGSGGALPLGGWTPSAPYDLPLNGQIGNRIPHPLLWTPHGVSSFFGFQGGIRTHFNARLQRSLATRRLDAECSFRFAPQRANRQSNPSFSSNFQTSSHFGIYFAASSLTRSSKSATLMLEDLPGYFFSAALSVIECTEPGKSSPIFSTVSARGTACKIPATWVDSFDADSFRPGLSGR